MAQRLPQEEIEETPSLDPDAVAHAYRRHRAERRARIERRRAAKRADRRFWVVLLVLLVGSIALAVVFWRQVEQLFGL